MIQNPQFNILTFCILNSSTQSTLLFCILNSSTHSTLLFCILNSSTHSKLLFSNTNTGRKFVLCEETCMGKVEWGNNPELAFMATDLSIMWGRQDINMHEDIPQHEMEHFNNLSPPPYCSARVRPSERSTQCNLHNLSCWYTYCHCPDSLRAQWL